MIAVSSTIMRKGAPVATASIQPANIAEHGYDFDSMTLSNADTALATAFHLGRAAISALILSTPAWAQTSSLSPPGEPPTPSAATTSSPTLMATAPGSSAMLGSVPRAAPLGFLAAIPANVPEVSNLKIGPKVTTVYALRKADVAVRMVEWSPLASSLMTPEVSTTTAETG